MSPPSEVLQNALTARGTSRRARAPVYLNRRGHAAGRHGAWLSEIGFLASAPFAYAEADDTNLLPAPGEPRLISRVEIHLYGAARDYQRLTSQLAVDRVERSTRSPGQAGVAPYPDVQGYLGAGDLGDDTTVPEKTARLLGAMRAVNSGTAYHTVITRAGAVYVTAPLDRPVLVGDAPDSSVAVAVEGACYRPREGATAVDAPLTEAQLVALAVLVAKVRAAHPGVALAWGEGLRFSGGAEGPVSGTEPWLTRSADARAAFIARVEREGAYDVATEVFLRNPPPPSRRAEAQVAIGHVDTAGESSLLLGAYAEIAAEDRAASMQENPRTRYFVSRARAAHREADASAEAAAHAAAAPALAAPPAPATNSGPFVYDYLTGRWGNQ